MNGVEVENDAHILAARTGRGATTSCNRVRNLVSVWPRNPYEELTGRPRISDEDEVPQFDRSWRLAGYKTGQRVNLLCAAGHQDHDFRVPNRFGRRRSNQRVHLLDRLQDGRGHPLSHREETMADLRQREFEGWIARLSTLDTAQRLGDGTQTRPGTQQVMAGVQTSEPGQDEIRGHEGPLRMPVTSRVPNKSHVLLGNAERDSESEGVLVGVQTATVLTSPASYFGAAAQGHHVGPLESTSPGIVDQRVYRVGGSAPAGHSDPSPASQLVDQHLGCAGLSERSMQVVGGLEGPLYLWIDRVSQILVGRRGLGSKHVRHSRPPELGLSHQGILQFFVVAEEPRRRPVFSVDELKPSLT